VLLLFLGYFLVSSSIATCFLCAFRSLQTDHSVKSLYLSSLPLFFVYSFPITAFKLIPLLVAVALPAPSHAIASPRGVKRSRTPEHRGNGHAEGDRDDGMCGGEAFSNVFHPKSFYFPSSVFMCLVAITIFSQFGANILFFAI